MAKQITRHVHIFPGAEGKIAVSIRRYTFGNVYHPGEESRRRLERVLLNHKPDLVSIDHDGPAVAYHITKTMDLQGQKTLPFSGTIRVEYPQAA